MTVWELKSLLDDYPDNYEVTAYDPGDPAVGIPEAHYGIFTHRVTIDDNYRPQRGTVVLILEP